MTLPDDVREKPFDPLTCGWSEGEQVRWIHVPRGGYGFPIPVDAVILQTSGGDRVRIEVERTDGTKVQRWVHKRNLRKALFRAADKGSDRE